MTSTRRQYRVDRREIAFLRFVLEAWDGLAVMTTLDAGLGTVEILVPPGREEELDGVLDGLRGEILMEPIGRPAGAGRETDNAEGRS